MTILAMQYMKNDSCNGTFGTTILDLFMEDSGETEHLPMGILKVEL